MTEEAEEKSATGEKPRPTTQQEFNLAAMEAIRHLAQYTVDVSTLAAMAARTAAVSYQAEGNHEMVKAIQEQAEHMRKSGLRYHNGALDLWEAFAKDAGPELVKPRELPPRQNVDD